VIRVYSGGRRGSHVEDSDRAATQEQQQSFRSPPSRLDDQPFTACSRDGPRDGPSSAILASGRVSVVTGSHQQSNMINGGSMEMNHIARASVTDAQPQGAAVDGNTTIADDVALSR